MATRWCLICGAEYLASVEECPDCEVTLVDEPLSQNLASDGDGQVAYDLAEWAAESRVMLEQLLEGAQVRRAWEGTTLVVSEVVETQVDNLVSHVEVTTLPTLDPLADRVAYDLSNWSDDMVLELQSRLDHSEVPFEFDERGDIVTLAEHEERVEALLDAFGIPEMAEEEDQADGEDGGGAGPGGGGAGGGAGGDARSGTSTRFEEEADAGWDVSGEDDGEDLDGGEDEDVVDASVVLSDLFVSTDRMMHNPRDHSGVLTFAGAAEAVDRMGIPYGFAQVAWQDIVNQVADLRELIEDDDSKDRDIKNQARDLRNTLRYYV